MLMRKYCFIIVALVAISAMAAVPKSMVLYTSNGEEVWSVSDIRKVIFDKTAYGSMKIYLKDGSPALTYSYSIIERGMFTTQSGVENLNISSEELIVTYRSSSQIVEVKSVEKVKSIQIYDLRGSLVLAETPASNDAEVSVTSLQNGLYIVKVVTPSGIVTQKIVKR